MRLNYVYIEPRAGDTLSLCAPPVLATDSTPMEVVFMFTVPHRTAFSHRHSIIPSVALALVLANLNPGFAASDDQVIASDPPFKLRASVVDLGLEPAISGENGAEDGGLYGALSQEGTGAGMGMPSTEPGQGTARVVANDGSEPLAVAAKSASDKTDK